MSTPPIKENRHRRSYSKRFKAEIVAQCLEGSDSIASLALAHGMNPNVLHHWVTQHRRYGMYDLGGLEDANVADVVAPKNWVAVSSNVVHYYFASNNAKSLCNRSSVHSGRIGCIVKLVRVTVPEFNVIAKFPFLLLVQVCNRDLYDDFRWCCLLLTIFSCTVGVYGINTIEKIMLIDGRTAI